MRKSVTVMIVDDHPPTRELLRSLIRTEGWSVICEAASAEQALAQLTTTKPDVVCLDVVMPGTSGIDVLQSVRQEAPRAAIVMITSSATPDVVKVALGQGADGFVVKPFNHERLIQTLSAAVKKRRSAQPAA